MSILLLCHPGTAPALLSSNTTTTNDTLFRVFTHCLNPPTQFVDMTAPELSPPGWREDVAPGLHQWTDISVYELHIRDFR